MKPPHAQWKKVFSRLVRHLWYTQAYVNTNPIHGENSGLRIDLRCRWVPSTCVLFVLPPSCLQHQHKSESKAGNQVTHIVTVVCAVVKAERCRNISPVVSPKWNSGGKSRHAACFLKTSRWESSSVPDFAAGKGRRRQKIMEMWKHLLKLIIDTTECLISEFWGFWHISVQKKKLWTHWRGTGFCLFWFPRRGPSSQRCLSRLCSQGRSPGASHHAHEWWSWSKLLDIQKEDERFAMHLEHF